MNAQMENFWVCSLKGELHRCGGTLVIRIQLQKSCPAPRMTHLAYPEGLILSQKSKGGVIGMVSLQHKDSA